MIDIQSGAGKTRFRIESVGVTGLRYPVLARDAASGEIQRTVADWRMGVSLAAEKRGTHMSRFVAELQARADQPLDLNEHFEFSRHLMNKLEADSSDIETGFCWFRAVRAPATGLVSQLEGRVLFRSQINADPGKSLVVVVPAKSLCPCSKAISDRGAHNQRSDISVTVTYDPNATDVIAIASLMELVEQSASSAVYPLLKREDEKLITEIAYDNAAFVEDIVRQAAQKLYDLPQVKAFSVEAINRESIHAHDCYARLHFKRD